MKSKIHDYQKIIKRMSKNFIIFLLFLPQLFYGQWVQVPNTLGGSVNDMFCISENVVFAGGNNGYLAKTIDGGVTWSTKTSGTTSNVVKVQFANANVGYILLQNKTIIKTSNGGDTWSTAITTNILDISVVSPTILYTCNNDGHLLKSIDGGINFTIINNTALPKNIQFVSENIGFGGSNPVERTTDGGQTWTVIGNCDSRNLDFGFENGLYHFVSENVGFTVFMNNVYKTVDGGINYELLTTINHHVGKIFATTENVLWLITVQAPLNGQPDYTTRLETVGNNIIRNDADFPILRCITFLNPTVGYGTDSVYTYQNITGNLLSLKPINNSFKLDIYFDSTNNYIKAKIPESNTRLITTINITNILGEVIYKNNYQHLSDINIDSSYLSTGLYFVNVFSGSSFKTQKLIIN
jgi:Secretion system C-terminal sorting domain